MRRLADFLLSRSRGWPELSLEGHIQVGIFERPDVGGQKSDNSSGNVASEPRLRGMMGKVLGIDQKLLV